MNETATKLETPEATNASAIASLRAIYDAELTEIKIVRDDWCKQATEYRDELANEKAERTKDATVINRLYDACCTALRCLEPDCDKDNGPYREIKVLRESIALAQGEFKPAKQPFISRNDPCNSGEVTI